MPQHPFPMLAARLRCSAASHPSRLLLRNSSINSHIREERHRLGEPIVVAQLHAIEPVDNAALMRQQLIERQLSASSETTPSFASDMIAAAVNIFVSDPMRKRVALVIGRAQTALQREAVCRCHNSRREGSGAVQYF